MKYRILQEGERVCKATDQIHVCTAVGSLTHVWRPMKDYPLWRDGERWCTSFVRVRRPLSPDNTSAKIAELRKAYRSWQRTPDCMPSARLMTAIEKLIRG